MTQIPSEDRDLLEKAIFLPMALTVFNHDLAIIKSSPFKLKVVYSQLIDNAITRIHIDLIQINRELHKRKLKFYELKRDALFTQFLFIYNGYKEHHNYFNPAIRNNVQHEMEYYLRVIYK